MTDTCKKFQKMPETDNCLTKSEYCVKLFKMEKLFDMALMPLALRKHLVLSLDSDGSDRSAFLYLRSVEQSVEKFVENGDNLYIHSETCGNGKTAWATRIIQAYLNSIWWKCDLSCKALFISVPRYLLALKDNISNANEYAKYINANVLKADLVVWDDIATKTATPFEAENLLSLVDTRMNEQKSNIFTSNLNVADMNNCMGSRLTSRIVNFSYDISFVGRDKRSLRSVNNS